MLPLARLSALTVDVACPGCACLFRVIVYEGRAVDRHCPDCGMELEVYQPVQSELDKRAARYLRELTEARGRWRMDTARTYTLIADLLERVRELEDNANGP